MISAEVCVVYYARPGNTEDNSSGKWSSADDTPLTEQSVIAAIKMAEELSNVKFDAVYCSKAERTRQTAEIIAKDITPTVVNCLYEMEIGPFEAMTPSEIVSFFKKETDYPSEESKKRLPKLWERKNGADPIANECLLDRKWHLQIDNFDDFCDSIQEEIKSIFKENIGKTILLVGHGTPGKYVLSLAKNVHVIELECKKAAYFKATVNQNGTIFLQ